MPMLEWRLLETGEQNGALNMAIDEALLLGVASASSPPTFRLFAWQQECLSLGFTQQVDNSLLDGCRQQKVTVVRRPTGGAAVLHYRDLCYSVTARLGKEPLPRALQEANLKINYALQAGLQLLGLPAEISFLADGRRTAELACAAAVSLYEVTVEGKKVLGSAQLQKEGCLLQHGSLALDFNPARLGVLLGRRGNRELAASATGLRQVAGRDFNATEVGAALAAGFAQCMGVRLERAGLTEAEQQAAKMLSGSRYRDLAGGGVAEKCMTC